MSQASEHVEWCLKKGKKELEESQRQGKKITHRGLREIKPDIEEAKKHLAKAEHNFDAITRFKEIGFSDWSITAGFYCIYHCFLAIAIKHRYESRNQECTVALMQKLNEEGRIKIDNKFIEMVKHTEIEKIQESNIIDMRENYTYGIEISVKDESKINELLENCREIIDISKEIIFR